MVARADDGGVIRVACNCGKQRRHGARKSLGKRNFTAPGQQHIVRRNAGLAGIEQLAVGNLDGGLAQVARRINNARRFAAQLQRGRRQVGGCCLGHLAAHCGRAGKKQVVKRQTGKFGSDSAIALHHAQFVRHEGLADQRGQQGRRLRRQLAGLEHHAVAGGQRRNDRAERQLHRIVPRRNHAHDAQGLALQAGMGRQQVQRRTDLDRLHPSGQVFQRAGNQRVQHKQVGNFSQLRRTHAKIGLHRLRQRRAMRVQQCADFQQPLAAHGQRNVGLRTAGAVLGVKKGLQARRRWAGSHRAMIGSRGFVH